MSEYSDLLLQKVLNTIIENEQLNYKQFSKMCLRITTIFYFNKRIRDLSHTCTDQQVAVKLKTKLLST